MDDVFLDHYNHELGYLRQLGAEFAEQYPGVAGRLGIDGFQCNDPYVERLLEGFAFLAARVHRRIDAEFPEFTGGLLDSIYPHLTRPVPSAAIISLQPDPKEGSLVDGYRLPRGTRLRGPISERMPTPVQMVTTREVELQPLTISDVRWVDRKSSTDAIFTGPTLRETTGAVLHLRLQTLGEIPITDLSLDRLMLHLRGGEVAVRMLESLQTKVTDISVGWSDRNCWTRLGRDAIGEVGFGDGDWLLPPDSRTFRGYQWLQEYFLLPEKFHFTELMSLRSAIEKLSRNKLTEEEQANPPTHLDIVIALNDSDPQLAEIVGPEHVSLHCVPVINLFSKRVDRITLDPHVAEHALVVDRSRPMDFEIWSIQELHGHGPSVPAGWEYRPLYHPPSQSGVVQPQDRYYTIARRPRQRSQRQHDFGHRSPYLGTEAWITLTDSGRESTSPLLNQLSATVMCTNRDLTLCAPAGGWTDAFTLDGPGPVVATRVLTGPTPPRESLASVGEQRCWRLIRHLQMEALPLNESDMIDETADATAILKDRLSLVCPSDVPLWRRQLEGIRSLRMTNSTRPLPLGGRIVYGRGVDVDLQMDESAFESSGMYLLASVLERFFATDSTLNTFVQMTVRSTTRGKIHTWPMRMGGTPGL